MFCWCLSYIAAIVPSCDFMALFYGKCVLLFLLSHADIGTYNRQTSVYNNRENNQL